MTNAIFVRCLLAGASLNEIVEETGLNRGTVGTYIRALRKLPGVCFIARFEDGVDGRPTVRIHKLGPGKDAPRPKPKRSRPGHVAKINAASLARRKQVQQQIIMQNALAGVTHA